MPRKIDGDELDEAQQAEVLRAFPYRWTTENKERAEPLFAAHGGPPTIELISDTEWLASYSFWFNKDDTLTAGRCAEWHGPANNWMPQGRGAEPL